MDNGGGGGGLPVPVTQAQCHVRTASRHVAMRPTWCCRILQGVFLRLLDKDNSSTITRDELHQLQLLAEEYAKVGKCTPDNLRTLCKAVLLGFNREKLAEDLQKQEESVDELQVIKVLKVCKAALATSA